MAELRHDKKVLIELEVPLTNIGKYPDGRYDPQSNQTVFHGRVEVDSDTAEDLLRRQKEYRQYESNLHRDKGHQIDAGALIGTEN